MTPLPTMTDEKKLFSAVATFPQSVTKESFSSLKLIPYKKIELYSIRTAWLLSRNVYQLFAFRSDLRSNLS